MESCALGKWRPPASRENTYCDFFGEVWWSEPAGVYIEWRMRRLRSITRSRKLPNEYRAALCAFLQPLSSTESQPRFRMKSGSLFHEAAGRPESIIKN